mmetsp:Transcript_1566/g.5012  ORF Transcript_1566/g.5012 Transcript_1566/m.5012 type:complete len:217 (+) Transcript_1566:792-1442(+)
MPRTRPSSTGSSTRGWRPSERTAPARPQSSRPSLATRRQSSRRSGWRCVAGWTRRWSRSSAASAPWSARCRSPRDRGSRQMRRVRKPRTTRAPASTPVAFHARRSTPNRAGGRGRKRRRSPGPRPPRARCAPRSARRPRPTTPASEARARPRRRWWGLCGGVRAPPASTRPTSGSTAPGTRSSAGSSSGSAGPYSARPLTSRRGTGPEAPRRRPWR